MEYQQFDIAQFTVLFSLSMQYNLLHAFSLVPSIKIHTFQLVTFCFLAFALCYHYQILTSMFDQTDYHVYRTSTQNESY
jgi:hypothetical protein